MGNNVWLCRLGPQAHVQWNLLVANGDTNNKNRAENTQKHQSTAAAPMWERLPSSTWGLFTDWPPEAEHGVGAGIWNVKV